MLRLGRRPSPSPVGRHAAAGLDVRRDRWIDAARDLLARWGVVGDTPNRELARSIVACLEQAHPDRELFVSLTARALRLAGVASVRAGTVAAMVFRNHLRTHFVDRLLTATRPAALAAGLDQVIDAAALDAPGGCVLASFHFQGYPLLPVALTQRGTGALVLRPRRGAPDRGHQTPFVYATDPSAPVQMVRAVRTGHPVLMMVDPVDGLGRTTQIRLFGRDVPIHVGAAWLATRAEVPIVPVVLDENDGRVVVRALPAIQAGVDLQATLQAVIGALELATVDAPERWLHWYAWLGGDEAAHLRQRLRASRELLWRGLAPS